MSKFVLKFQNYSFNASQSTFRDHFGKNLGDFDKGLNFISKKNAKYVKD